MSDKDFMDLMRYTEKYLKTRKTFKKNPTRFEEVNQAANIAKKLFKDATVYLEDDPLQMGAVALCIKDYDIEVLGEDEIKLFNKMVSKADNFEIVTQEDKVELAILFEDVLILTK